MSPLFRGGILVSVLLCMAARDGVAAKPPAWVMQLTAAGADSLGGAAQFLLDESRVVVPDHGRIQEYERGAVLVREKAGASAARCAVYYERATAEVKVLHAWLRHPNGHVDEFDRSDALDQAILGSGALLSDQRSLTIRAPDAPVGAIFAWESAVESEPLVAQWQWLFGSPFPSRHSRFEITLPTDAEVEAVGAPASVETTHDGSRWSWEMQHIPALVRVALGPERPGADRVLRVSVRTRDGRNPAGAAFARWNDVGAWSERLTESQAQLDDDLRGKARELTAGLRDPYAQARAIGEFVQRTNYVAMNLGLGLGFGYRPRPAAEVLRTGYGDCKDKANLMRALLRATGQEAWLVAVYSGDRHYVRSEWPTVRQFNHCIVAMRPPTGTPAQAIDASSSLGPLMFFDPTDPCTSFGELPLTLQGSYGMVQSAQVSQLVRLPVAGEGTFGVQRRVRASLQADGALAGEWEEASRGSAAALDRCLLREGKLVLRERDQRTLSGSRGTAGVTDWAALTSPDSLVMRRRIGIQVPGFAQTSGPRIMTFAPCLMSGTSRPPLSDSARTEPLDLDAESLDEEARYRIPDGWLVDEMPKPEHIETELGAVDATWAMDGSEFVYRRRWHTSAMRLPAARYPDVRAFYADLRRIERARVVLIRE